MSALLIAGWACLALGVVGDLAWGAGRAHLRPVSYVAAAAGSACLAAAGALALSGGVRTYELGAVLGLGPTALRLDRLAGLFLVLTSGTATLVSAFSAAWVRPPGRVRGRGLAAAYNTMLGAVAAVIAAGDAFTFLFAWEALSATFYLLASFERRRPGAGDAGLVTYGLARVGGGALLLGVLLAAAQGGSLVFAEWGSRHGGMPSILHSASLPLIVFGLGAKVGLAPLQAWMPSGYSAATGPARAGMAGVAVNAGVYALWRFLAVLGPPPLWLAMVILVLGGVTALLGILHAAVQPRLGRLVAYSSVENGGIIMAGFGVAVAGDALHAPMLLAAGLLAATLQVVAHALAKSALFLATAEVEAATGTDRLDDLKGIGRGLPVASAVFAAGALALAAMPPTLGFVSEWFVFEALMQQFRVHDLLLRLAMSGAGALLALAAGVAALTFVRLLGLIFTGREPHPELGEHRIGIFGWGPAVLLGAACVVLPAVTPLQVRVLAAGLGALVPPRVTAKALASPFVLQPVYEGFSILSPSWYWIALPVLFVGVAAFAVAASRGSLLRPRRVPVWMSAAEGLPHHPHYTAFAYANPLRHVLGAPLRARRRLEATPEGARYEADVVEVTERYLYAPALRVLAGIVGVARRLQSGRLGAYLAYMLVALIALLAAVSLSS